MKSCILCGGDHEPNNRGACSANEDGAIRRMEQIGPKAWNRFSWMFEDDRALEWVINTPQNEPEWWEPLAEFQRARRAPDRTR